MSVASALSLPALLAQKRSAEVEIQPWKLLFCVRFSRLRFITCWSPTIRLDSPPCIMRYEDPGSLSPIQKEATFSYRFRCCTCLTRVQG